MRQLVGFAGNPLAERLSKVAWCARSIYNGSFPCTQIGIREAGVTRCTPIGRGCQAGPERARFLVAVRWYRSVTWATALVAMLMPVASQAAEKSQVPPSNQPATELPKSSPRVETSGPQKRKPSTTGARKISLEGDFLVEGKLEKPSAYYILRRSQAGFDWARLDATFLPLVLESVQDPLF